jgi:predicted alpha/beta hydrolase family esterase
MEIKMYKPLFLGDAKNTITMNRHSGVVLVTHQLTSIIIVTYIARVARKQKKILKFLTATIQTQNLIQLYIKIRI